MQKKALCMLSLLWLFYRAWLQYVYISKEAAHPQAGDIMQGTGGIRKWRWAAQGRGKSGGVRVIYYYHNRTIPLFLLTVFGKGEKANLSKSECNDLSKFTDLLLRQYGGKNE